METKIYGTKDLSAAATLITLKFYMIGIDYEVDGVRGNLVGYFKFEDTPTLQDALKKYNQSLIAVEPKAFMTNVRALRAEVTNVYKNPITPYQDKFKEKESA